MSPYNKKWIHYIFSPFIEYKPIIIILCSLSVFETLSKRIVFLDYLFDASFSLANEPGEPLSNFAHSV